MEKEDRPRFEEGYLEGVSDALKFGEEAFGYKSEELHERYFNGQLKLLETATKELGLQFPLVSESLEQAGSVGSPREMLRPDEETELAERIKKVAEERRFRGLFIDRYFLTSAPEGVRSDDHHHLGAFLLPDGELCLLSIDWGKGDFVRRELRPRFSLDKDLVNLAIAELQKLLMDGGEVEEGPSSQE